MSKKDAKPTLPITDAQPSTPTAKITHSNTVDKTIWDHVTDHPKIALALAFIALGATFAPRVSVPATWACVSAAFLLSVAFTAGFSQVKLSKHPTAYKVLVAICTGIGLASYGYWLTGGRSTELKITSRQMILDGAYMPTAVRIEIENHGGEARAEATDIIHLMNPMEYSPNGKSQTQREEELWQKMLVSGVWSLEAYRCATEDQCFNTDQHVRQTSCQP